MSMHERVFSDRPSPSAQTWDFVLCYFVPLLQELQAEPARSVHNHSHLPLQNAWPVHPLLLYQQRQAKR
jgi:hypothetical protein